jgi:hypothetical protein
MNRKEISNDTKKMQEKIKKLALLMSFSSI